MSYPDGTGSREPPMSCASMHDILTTNQILSYLTPLDENESAFTDISVVDIHDLFQDGDLQLPDIEPPTCQDTLAEAYVAKDLGINPVKPFQQSSYSSIPTPGVNEAKIDFSQTSERLLLQMEKFTSTIYQYGDSATRLESKINACTSSIGRIEQHVNAIEHRIDNMEKQLGGMLGGMNHQLGDMNEKIMSLDSKLKTLDSYLFEIVKRERDMMKDFCDFARK